jgi:hypothetical protein
MGESKANPLEARGISKIEDRFETDREFSRKL